MTLKAVMMTKLSLVYFLILINNPSGSITICDYYIIRKKFGRAGWCFVGKISMNSSFDLNYAHMGDYNLEQIITYNLLSAIKERIPYSFFECYDKPKQTY